MDVNIFFLSICLGFIQDSVNSALVLWLLISYRSMPRASLGCSVWKRHRHYGGVPGDEVEPGHVAWIYKGLFHTTWHHAEGCKGVRGLLRGAAITREFAECQWVGGDTLHLWQGVHQCTVVSWVMVSRCGVITLWRYIYVYIYIYMYMYIYTYQHRNAEDKFVIKSYFLPCLVIFPLFC